MSLKLVIVGEGAVGKSSLTIRFVQGAFISEYDPTIESSYRRVLTVDNEPVVLDILDTAGQEEYACIRDSYLRVGQGFMLVFSLTAPASLGWCQDMHSKILQVKDVDNFPMVLVGNKADLTHQRAVPADQAQQLAAALRMPYFEASAKTGQNIEEAFTCISKMVVSTNKKGSFDPDAPLKKRAFGCMLL